MTDLERVRLARVTLSRLAEPGNLSLFTRVAAHGPLAVLESLLAALRDGTLDEVTAAALRRAQRLAPDDLALARRLGCRVVVPEDDEWPARVDDLVAACDPAHRETVERDAAPPLCLWVRGPHRLDEALDRSVAVVGARAATAYGAHVAREIGYGLAERGWTVVSGGAFGVDAYAHRGALAAGGCTVAVLATGIDRAYPVAHTALFDRIAADGLLVSEWPPGTEPYRHRFLIRNRLIAAATRGTVMVEAAARSGALQTLRRAGQLGRYQMAVPGPVTSAMSVGCHEQLRRPDVHLVTGVPHILELVGGLGTDLADPPRGPEDARDALDPTARRLLDALLARRPLGLAEVAARARLETRLVMRLLPDLELRGFVTRRGDGFLLAPGYRGRSGRGRRPAATGTPGPHPAGTGAAA